MKTFLSFVSAMILLNFIGVSQDVIYRTNGDSLSCKITKIDSTKVYFDLKQGANTTNTFLNRDEISGYKLQPSVSKVSRLNSVKKHIVCLSFDPIGFITMGPVVTGELLLQLKDQRVGFGIYTGLRLTNLGIASNALLSGGTMGSFSYSVPIALRIYPRTKFSTDGVFVGPHFEFGKTTFTDGDKNFIRAFAAEIGYKWTYKSGFTLELFDILGLIQTKDDSKPIVIPGMNIPQYEPQWENLAFVFYMLSLKLGFSF